MYLCSIKIAINILLITPEKLQLVLNPDTSIGIIRKNLIQLSSIIETYGFEKHRQA
jgi:hypothetical protein